MAAKKKVAGKKVAKRKPRPRDVVSTAGRCGTKTKDVTGVLRLLGVKFKMFEGNVIQILNK